jgi:membrane protein
MRSLYPTGSGVCFHHREIAKRVCVALGHNHFSIIAAGVAFYAMLSIFPALAALVSLYGRAVHKRL